MYIALMIPLDKAAMDDGALFPLGWFTDGGGVFGIEFPEVDGGIPRLAEDAAEKVQKEVESFFLAGHARMFLQTRSEAVVQCVRDMVRAKAYLNAAIYLVRGNKQGLEEERFDILPDGSIQPPLVFGKISSQPREREVGFELGEVDHHGELELILKVNGVKDSAWLSREMWEGRMEEGLRDF
jgi:hypothetical protein